MRATAPERPTGTRPAGDRPPSHRRPANRRRALALSLAGMLALGLAGLAGQDLVAGGAPAGDEPARPLSGAEADRLARMRQLNWDHGRAGVRATLGEGADAVALRGWVDWRRPVIYLARSGPGETGTTELIQAVPGLTAYRAAETAGTEPPVDPPGDGWRLRQPGAGSAAGAPVDPGLLDSLTTLLLTVGAREATSADLLADSEARWLGADRVAGHEVDILLGPALPPRVPPAGPAVPEPAHDPSLAAMGGAVQYWLDGEARLHRLEAVLSRGTSVRVDLDRGDRTVPPVLDALGGAAIEPRPVTDQEAGTLSRLRQRNREAGGGEVALTLPDSEAAGAVRASGWLDWRHQVAYLATYRDGAPDGLLWADGDGIAGRRDHPPQRGLPPLPMPPPGGWQWSRWEERGDDDGGFDLDLLINEALSLSGWREDGAATLKETARWLRTDALAGTAVTVYEIPRSIESRLDPGEARLRYWVDDESGVLRRLEIRTRSGGFGQLDLAPGPVPRLR